MTLHVPALRDHADDIPALVTHFLADLGAHSIRVSDEAMNLMKKYRWPGNIRALRNCIERAAIAIQGTGLLTIRPEHIQLDDTTVEKNSLNTVPQRLLPRRFEDLSEKNFEDYMVWAEQLYFGHAFSAAMKNKSRLAEKMGLSRDYLHRKLKSLGVGAAEATTSESLQ
jgi:two-component system nitrogen regulation response regulator NtrX